MYFGLALRYPYLIGEHPLHSFLIDVVPERKPNRLRTIDVLAAEDRNWLMFAGGEKKGSERKFNRRIFEIVRALNKVKRDNVKNFAMKLDTTLTPYYEEFPLHVTSIILARYVYQDFAFIWGSVSDKTAKAESPDVETNEDAFDNSIS